MVIRTPLSHPETIEYGGTQRKIMIILHLLSSRGAMPDDMRRQIMVFLQILSSKGSELDDMRRQIMFIRKPFCHPETIESGGTQRQIMVILHLFVIQRQRAR